METLTPSLPRNIGRYEIQEVVGSGAMGVVYRATDPLIGRTVAIKKISAAVATGEWSAEFRTRFFREARAAGNLRHPNIVTVYDLGEDEGTPFMAQEFVEGESLAQKLRRQGPLSPAEAVRIVRQVAEGLGFAHGRGVVHRDIKPDNILIDPQGRAVITDFGIARMDNSDVTRTGEILGTPHFMSPEQILGKPLDGKSDLFSLGVVLYQLLTGEKPFTGSSPTAVCYQIVHASPRAIPAEVPVSQHLRGIIAKLLQKEPGARYASAQELIRALDGKKWSTIPLPVKTIRLAPPIDRAARRWRRILIWGTGLLALGMIVSGFALLRRPVDTPAVAPSLGKTTPGTFPPPAVVPVPAAKEENTTKPAAKEPSPVSVVNKSPTAQEVKKSPPAELREDRSPPPVPEKNVDPPPPVSVAEAFRPGVLGLVVQCPFVQCEVSLSVDGELRWKRTFQGGRENPREDRPPPVFVDLSPGRHQLRLDMRGPRQGSLPPFERQVDVKPGKTAVFLVTPRRFPPSLALTPLPEKPLPQ